MAQLFRIHPENPQKRLISQAAEILKKGGVVIYPTDSCYGLGCCIGEREALERIRFIRHLDETHHFSLICKDLSELGNYAKVSNPIFRLIKSLTPGPYTFILPATKEVPKRLLHPKRKTIGLRVPENQILQDLLAQLGEPLMSTSLLLPANALPDNEPEFIDDIFGSKVDLILDGGNCGPELTTIIDCAEDTPVLVREGKGPINFA